MGMMRAGPPIRRGIGKLLLRYEIPAVTTVVLLFVDLVTACLHETGELLFHGISSENCEHKIYPGAGVLSISR